IKNGSRLCKDNIIIYYLKQERPRLAVIISAKVTGSAGRNRMKRWIREKFRKEKEFLKNYGIAVIFKPGAQKYPYREIIRRVHKLWKEARIIKNRD
ncbi:MAG: ribonuclease P protein component, partial [Elusimicrobiota bacterium]|nr:ribonuclease P protein component [Elusimicrobiota bacterium]